MQTTPASSSLKKRNRSPATGAAITVDKMKRMMEQRQRTAATRTDAPETLVMLLETPLEDDENTLGQLWMFFTGRKERLEIMKGAIDRMAGNFRNHGHAQDLGALRSSLAGFGDRFPKHTNLDRVAGLRWMLEEAARGLSIERTSDENEAYEKFTQRDVSIMRVISAVRSPTSKRRRMPPS